MGAVARLDNVRVKSLPCEEINLVVINGKTAVMSDNNTQWCLCRVFTRLVNCSTILGSWWEESMHMTDCHSFAGKGTTTGHYLGHTTLLSVHPRKLTHLTAPSTYNLATIYLSTKISLYIYICCKLIIFKWKLIIFNKIFKR